MRILSILIICFIFNCSSDTPVNMDEVLVDRGGRFKSIKNLLGVSAQVKIGLKKTLAKINLLSILY